MNVRELLHFFSERLCSRAQWEIRELAKRMLEECKKVLPAIFEEVGPKCVILGYCPENQQSCGLYLSRNL
jgi:thymidylate synthase (FAD)